MIPFTRPSITELEKKKVQDAFAGKISGDGKYTKEVYEHFKALFGISRMLLTTSGTHALDMSAILLNLQKGDEVILPSYTFVSTANAIALRGAKPVFCDVSPDTMNMDENKIEALITKNTKAIYPVHYAGVCCDMDKINELASSYKLEVVEDAAQAVGSYYKGHPAGTLGTMGCYSFHETKNYVMGEGGAIVLSNRELFGRAEIVREKGTDRGQFLRGEVDKYTWRDMGSSYLPSDILSAVLAGQMERFYEIKERRMHIWNRYHELLHPLEEKGMLRRPYIPADREHNAHMYYVMVNSTQIRNKVLTGLREGGIGAVFHYIPLHSSPVGEKLGYKKGDCPMTEKYAARLIRLPLFPALEDREIEFVVEALKKELTDETI